MLTINQKITRMQIIMYQSIAVFVFWKSLYLLQQIFGNFIHCREIFYILAYHTSYGKLMTFLHTIPRSIVSCKTVHIAHSFTPIIKHTFIPQLRIVFVPSQTIHPTRSGDKAGFTIFFCRKSKLTPFGLQW